MSPPLMSEPDDILVIDIGGSHVKFYLGSREEAGRFDSGKSLTAEDAVDHIQSLSAFASARRIALGIPGRIAGGRAEEEPVNLGHGWQDFDFEAAFGKPTRVINDASLQALGAYRFGRMLFLGLGTAVGSTLITENVIVPMELGEFESRHHIQFGQLLGKKSRKELGHDQWEEILHELLTRVRHAFFPDEIVLGGGLSELVEELPEGVRRGGNEDAYLGGLRLWETMDLKEGDHVSRWLLA